MAPLITLMGEWCVSLFWCVMLLIPGNVIDLTNGMPGLDDPQQVHISTGSYDQMVIAWSTMTDTQQSLVVYGKGTQVDREASGHRRKFVDQGLLHRVQYIHKVVLKDLEPDTEYTYMVGSDKYGFSDKFVFNTWPSGDTWAPRLVIFGDLGYENARSLPRIQAEIFQGMYNALIHVGDFGYNMEDNEGRLGDNFMRLIEPVSTSLPYMTCPGNHENAYNFLHYRQRFDMPGDESKRMYYSFTMGPIRFISVSTEFIFYPQYGLSPIAEHYQWLEQELINANKPENRARQPWVITFGHRPMYCSSLNTDDCSFHESLIRVGIPIFHLYGWEKLYYENGVDLAIWGHEHNYERLWPVYNRKVRNGSYEHPYTNPKATVHITSGSAGNKHKLEPFNGPNAIEDWSAFQCSDYGYLRMKALNATHLQLEQVSDEKDGEIIDKFMIIQEHHGSFPHDPSPLIPGRDGMN